MTVRLIEGHFQTQKGGDGLPPVDENQAQLAQYLQQIGQENVQLIYQRNQGINTTQQALIELQQQWREELVNQNQKIETLEREQLKIVQENKELLEMQKIKEKEIEAQQEQIQGFHQVARLSEEQIAQLKGEIGRLQGRNEELQKHRDRTALELDQQKRNNLALREEFQRQLFETQRAEREKADQRVLDEGRFRDLTLQIKSIKSQYDAEWMTVLKIASCLPIIFAFIGGLFWFVVGGSFAMAWRIGTSTSGMLQLTKEMNRAVGSYLVLHERLGKPPLNREALDLSKSVSL